MIKTFSLRVSSPFQYAGVEGDESRERLGRSLGVPIFGGARDPTPFRFDFQMKSLLASYEGFTDKHMKNLDWHSVRTEN